MIILLSFLKNKYSRPKTDKAIIIDVYNSEEIELELLKDTIDWKTIKILLANTSYKHPSQPYPQDTSKINSLLRPAFQETPGFHRSRALKIIF